VKSENAGMGRKMPFMDGHWIAGCEYPGKGQPTCHADVRYIGRITIDTNRMPAKKKTTYQAPAVQKAFELLKRVAESHFGL
jgi:hypothetical protein